MSKDVVLVKKVNTVIVDHVGNSYSYPIAEYEIIVLVDIVMARRFWSKERYEKCFNLDEVLTIRFE